MKSRKIKKREEKILKTIELLQSMIEQIRELAKLHHTTALQIIVKETDSLRGVGERV